MRYILDTNMWAEMSRGRVSCDDLHRSDRVELVLAPLAITELVRGIIRGRERYFPGNQAMVRCMMRGNPEVLDLPKVFINRLLWNLPSGISNVRPEHYVLLLSWLLGAKTLADFLRKAEEPGSIWTRMTNLYEIHDAEVDKQLGSLEKMAEQTRLRSIPLHISSLYSLGGLRPNPDWIEEKFSAALEFLVSSIKLVRQGANPAKNNPGLYLDLQFLWYLGDPELTFVSGENFTSVIKVSPQATRIISAEAFFRL